MTDIDYNAAANSAAAAWQVAIDIVEKTRLAIESAEAEIARTAPAAILSAGGDLMAGAAAHTAATAHLAYVKAALSAADNRAAQLELDYHAAECEKHRPAFRAAIARRIAAAAGADAARAALEVAEGEFKAATAAIQRTHAAGLPRPFDGSEMFRVMGTKAQEIAFWGDLA